MTVVNKGMATTRALFGQRVDRATAALPQTAQSALFTVSGGRVIVMAIIGEVTTVIQTQANNTKLVANPTVGTDVDLTSVLSITADEVGTLYGLTGEVTSNAFLALVGINAGAAPIPQQPIVVAKGTIDLNCAASNTGAVKWSIWWLPFDDGATVTAA